MSVGSRFFVGLDLGQAQDHSAIAVVERSVVLGERDLTTYERREVVTLKLRLSERVALGTSYPAVVERVGEITGSRELAGRCQLVVDATGVGRPVVDLLAAARLGCRMWPVVITGGDTENYRGGYYRVPKRDLVVQMQVAVQRGELGIAAGLRDGEVLLREMREMRVRVTDGGREQFGVWRSGEHDDLVLAAALASWGAKRVFPLCGEGTVRVV